MKKYKFLNATNLKIIALILMILDHIHEMFYYVGAPLWLTKVGRVVFPIFLFLAADSFYYTSNKYKYIRRLFIASVLMSAGNILFTKFLPNDEIVLMNNAFSTFFVSALLMLIWDKVREFAETKDFKSILKAAGILILIIVMTLPYMSIFLLGNTSLFENNPDLMKILLNIGILIPNILSAEGGIVMVLMGLFFYIFREKRINQYIGYALLSGYIFYTAPQGVQWYMIFALPFMMFYNGKKGSGHKWLFYIVYPLHIYLMYVISTLIFN